MTKLFFKQDGNSLNLFLAAPAEKINAVAGEISLPAGLELEQIQIGNSLVSFWIDRPALVEAKIVFSGIIPGGYQGPAGQIIALILQGSPLETRSQGRPLTIEVENARVLLHDGLGTEASVETPPFFFRSADKIVAEVADISPPEEFAPLISSDPTIWNGANFLVFQTQDKQSGIDHYEVKEGRELWQTATSPYLISNQDLDVRIQVKAVDLAGNERIAIAISPSWDYLDYGFFVTITIALVLCFFGLKKFFRRF